MIVAKQEMGSLLGAARSVLGAEWHQDELVRGRIYAAGRCWTKQRARLRRAQGRSRRMQRRLAYVALATVSGRIVACLLSSHRRKEKLTFLQLEERALSLNGHVGVEEPITAFRKKGEKRILMEFGPKRAALQWMLKEVLLALMPVAQSEYAAKGKGRDAAVGRLRDELNQDDHREVVFADVKGCFPSITIETVCSLLPIPRSAVKGIVFIEGKEVINVGNGLSLTTVVNKALREGLPQGSFLSPLVASYVMASMLDHLPCPGQAMTYVDDIAVRAASKGEGKAIKLALHSGASAHFPGPTSFKRLDVVRFAATSRKAHYLGYQLRVGETGQIRITPTAKAIRKFFAKMAVRLRTTKQGQMHEVAEQMADSFRSSQALWDFNDDAAGLFELQVHEAVLCEKARRSTVHQVKKWKSGTQPYGLKALLALM